MRTVENLKHGRRESHCGREGVGGHNGVHLALRGPSVAARCVRSVRSYPLQAVSICAYICVLIGTKTPLFLILAVGFPPLASVTTHVEMSDKTRHYTH